MLVYGLTGVVMHSKSTHQQVRLTKVKAREIVAGLYFCESIAF
jgi:hypothetical protein